MRKTENDSLRKKRNSRFFGEPVSNLMSKSPKSSISGSMVRRKVQLNPRALGSNRGRRRKRRQFTMANTARIDVDAYSLSQHVVVWFTPDDCLVLEQ